MLSSAAGARVGDLNVRVGTLNPAKLRAVERALARLDLAAEISGVDVESGVPDQPVGFPEIVRGARNRALAALEAGGELGVGIEDGLVVLDALGPGEILNIGCAFVIGEGEGRRSEGYGLSSGFSYPPACSRKAVAERAPIGDLFDDWWKAFASGPTQGTGADAPSGRTVGNIGKLTRGALCRDEYAEHAVLCAMIRFLHPETYSDPELSDIVANPVRQGGPGAARAAVRE